MSGARGVAQRRDGAAPRPRVSVAIHGTVTALLLAPGLAVRPARWCWPDGSRPCGEARTRCNGVPSPGASPPSRNVRTRMREVARSCARRLEAPHRHGLGAARHPWPRRERGRWSGGGWPHRDDAGAAACLGRGRERKRGNVPHCPRGGLRRIATRWALVSCGLLVVSRVIRIERLNPSVAPALLSPAACPRRACAPPHQSLAVRRLLPTYHPLEQT